MESLKSTESAAAPLIKAVKKLSLIPIKEEGRNIFFELLFVIFSQYDKFQFLHRSLMWHLLEAGVAGGVAEVEEVLLVEREEEVDREEGEEVQMYLLRLLLIGTLMRTIHGRVIGTTPQVLAFFLCTFGHLTDWHN